MFGQMGESMKENGSIIKCMDLVNMNGKTAENMKVNTSLIKNMA